MDALLQLELAEVKAEVKAEVVSSLAGLGAPQLPVRAGALLAPQLQQLPCAGAADAGPGPGAPLREVMAEPRPRHLAPEPASAACISCPCGPARRRAPLRLALVLPLVAAALLALTHPSCLCFLVRRLLARTLASGRARSQRWRPRRRHRV